MSDLGRDQVNLQRRVADKREQFFNIIIALNRMMRVSPVLASARATRYLKHLRNETQIELDFNGKKQDLEGLVSLADLDYIIGVLDPDKRDGPDPDLAAALAGVIIREWIT